MKRNHLFPGVLLSTTFALLLVTVTFGESYDLHAVKGIAAFNGSAAAREILARNGFVVSDPAFKQIFEAYIESPQIEPPSETNHFGQSLPAFITTDSAWHTYHVLLEEGVKELEQVQARRLLQFSQELLAAANEQSGRLGPVAGELRLIASVGLGLQDAQQRQSLGPEAKRIVEALRGGSTAVELPIGFPLSPLQFRAQSFCKQSPELSDYFAARQWYASVVFRLNNAHETQSAIALATLINGNPDLLVRWQQLSEPFDAFLAPAEDGTIREYISAASAVLGTNTFIASDAKLAEIQKKLDALVPMPRVSDQLLTPEQYANFARQTRGFRLFPPRQLPCAVCFHNTVDPKIPGRMYPSGLDFLAAAPVLRSPAAVRAVQSQFGKSASELILKAERGPMPDSLYGEAMHLLATLQEPLPQRVAPAFRTEAWHDLQLWTQLGAWAEQRHTWALHTKLSVSYMGMVTPPKGMVTPYPEFFSGLAKLTRRTAAAFQKVGLEQQFEIKAVASQLLELLTLSQSARTREAFEALEKRSGELEQLGRFKDRYYEQHRAELEQDNSRNTYKRLEQDLQDLAQRCAESGTTNEADTETLRMFYDCRQDIAHLINDFAPVCDRLTGLAEKSLNGETLTEEDAKWIEGYGVTLAGFHFYYGNSYEVPRDDFPIVTRVFSNPLTDSMLYAGLARPQALYVIVPDGESLQLYRGAVLTYREFVRPNDQLLDDASWREMISKGQTPPAPPFTKSFLAEKSVADWMTSLRELKFDAGYDEARDILWHLGSQATESEVPELIRMMEEIPAGTNAHRMERWITQVQEGTWETNDFEASANWISEVRDGISDIIARLPWESCQADLIPLLASTNAAFADAAAHILATKPAGLNVGTLVAGFDAQPTRTRRLYCAILSRLPQQTDSTRKLLVEALHDPADGVRWQAALAIYKSGWSDAQSHAALLATLNDTNELVGAAAAYTLAKLGATNTAPELLARLTSRLQLPPTASEARSPQVLAIVQGLDVDVNHADQLLNVDNLTLRLSMPVTDVMRRSSTMRMPPMPIEFALHNYNLADALIEALAELDYTPAADELFKLRDTDYDTGATRALARLAPDRVTAELLAVARDRRVDSYLRERALVTLCNIQATNCVRDLIPLLDDTTPIEYSRALPGPPTRVCDSAARTIAILLGWENRMSFRFARPDEREALIRRAKEWATLPP